VKNDKMHDLLTENTIKKLSDAFGVQQLTGRLSRSSNSAVKEKKNDEERSNSRPRSRPVKSKVFLICSSPKSSISKVSTPPPKLQSSASSLFPDRRTLPGGRVLLSGNVVAACPEDRKTLYKEAASPKALEVLSTSKRSVSAGKEVDSSKRRSIGGGGCQSGEIITGTTKCLRKSWEGGNGANDRKDRTTPKQAKEQVKACVWSTASTLLSVFSLTLLYVSTRCKSFESQLQQFSVCMFCHSESFNGQDMAEHTLQFLIPCCKDGCKSF
jgi:hypothetical protein